MRPASRRFFTDEELYTAALRALMRRSYSVHEMRAYLEQRSREEEMAGRVVARLKTEKLVDDARYALEFARQRALSRRQGRFRIARELRTRGVPDCHIESALAEIFAETDEAQLVQKAIERKLKNVHGPLDARRAASLQRALLRAGFDGETIRRQLRLALAGRAATMPELPEHDATEEG